MVPWQTKQRAAVKHINASPAASAKTKIKGRGKIPIIFLVCLFIGVFLVSVILLVMLVPSRGSTNETEIGTWCPTIGGAMIDSDECDALDNPIRRINLQPVVDAWVSSIGGDKGVAIYDLDAHELVGIYQADKKFATASLYKLFVVYAGYRKVQSGEWSAEARAGGTGHNILECLDLAIRESHSPCAETLWAMIGRSELDNIVQNEFGLTGVTVGKLSATPLEIVQIMKKFYNHYEITDTNLIDVMKSSFLDQPATTYNWRQGLPSGFSDDVKVYNKVGWHRNGNRWAIYDDAAIVKFKNGERTLIVVVMTNGVDHMRIRDFAAQIEQSLYEQISP